MKGLDISISLVVTLMVSIVVILVVATLMSGNLEGFETFYENLEWTEGLY